MTLDGHLKTGLAASLLILIASPSIFPQIQGAILQAALFAFWFGNIGPDLTEMKLIKHRTHTHYPWYYVAVATLCYFNVEQSWLFISAGASWIIVAYCAGAICHILCDIPYGGIPYFNPRKPITLMRIPFDGALNRVIEHSVLLSLMLGVLLWNVDLDFSVVEQTYQGLFDDSAPMIIEADEVEQIK